MPPNGLTGAMEVTFRPLTEDDLPMLHGWLNEPGVVRWWEGDDVSWEGVVRDYGPGRDDDGTEHWVAVVDGRDVGWIQCSPVESSEEELAEWLPFGVERTAAGIDYLIGEPAMRGRGLGAAMIRSFVRDVVFARHQDRTQACASPVVENRASWGALARAGFRQVGDFTDSLGQRCRLMVIDRAEAERV